RIRAKTSCATELVPYAGTFVTTMFWRFACSTSTTLYPVASTPMYFSDGSDLSTESVNGVLLVSRISASFDLSYTSSGAVRSNTCQSTPAGSASHERSPGFNVYPSRTTSFICRYQMGVSVSSFDLVLPLLSVQSSDQKQIYMTILPRR